MVQRVEALGLKAHVIVGTERTVIAAIGDKRDDMRSRSKAGRAWPKSCRSSRRTKSPAARSSPSRRWSSAGSLQGGRRMLGVIAGPARSRTRADRRDGPRGQGGRGHGPARRGLQAPHQPLQLPGPEGRRPEDAGRRPRGNRPGRRDRSDVDRRRRAGRPTMPTCCKSAPATCRTTGCWKRSASRASRCCSSAARPPRWKSCCWPPSTS